MSLRCSDLFHHVETVTSDRTLESHQHSWKVGYAIEVYCIVGALPYVVQFETCKEAAASYTSPQ